MNHASIDYTVNEATVRPTQAALVRAEREGREDLPASHHPADRDDAQSPLCVALWAY